MSPRLLLQLNLTASIGLLAWRTGFPMALVVVATLVALAFTEHADVAMARQQELEREVADFKQVVGDQVGALQKALKDVSDKVVSNSNAKAFGR